MSEEVGNMAREVLGKCPVCDGECIIIETKCKSCDTTIRGKFDLCKFCRLTEDQKIFAEIFIKNRGNIKEIEKELDISYPTVRNKLEELVGALGYSKASVRSIDRKAILEKLSRGEISKEEALKELVE
jgi:hypothetical protein